MLHGDHRLSLEEGTKDDGTAESKDDKRHEDAAPVEEEDGSLLWWLISDDGLSSNCSQEVLDKVGGVQDSHLLNAQGSEHSEVCEVVVDKGNHTVGSVDLSVKLSENGRKDEHGKSYVKEYELDSLGKAKHINFRVEGGTTLVNHEDDQKHHELPSHQESIKVVTAEDHTGNFVSDWVRVFVENWIDGRKTNKRCLATLNHGKPGDGKSLLFHA